MSEFYVKCIDAQTMAVIPYTNISVSWSDPQGIKLGQTITVSADVLGNAKLTTPPFAFIPDGAVGDCTCTKGSAIGHTEIGVDVWGNVSGGAVHVFMNNNASGVLDNNLKVVNGQITGAIKAVGSAAKTSSILVIGGLVAAALLVFGLWKLTGGGLLRHQ